MAGVLGYAHGPHGVLGAGPETMGVLGVVPLPATDFASITGGVPATASLRPYDPTWRDRIATWLMNLGAPAATVDGLIGSRGLGISGRGTGMGLVDFTPLGVPFWADEARRAGEGGSFADAAMAAAGSLPVGKAAKGASKLLPMDDASRMARAKEMGFRDTMPLTFATAPADEQISGAAVRVGDDLYSGHSHAGALENALKKGVPESRLDELDVQHFGFVTNAGRFVDLEEAGYIAAKAGQASGERVNGLASDFLTLASEPARSTVRTGATAPGLSGGQGVWGSMSAPVSSPGSMQLWHRAKKPASLDASGLRPADIQATLAGAWENGFDAVMLKNYTRPGSKTPENVIVVRDPSQLRSPDAAFDPAKMSLADILASGLMVTGAGAAGLAIAMPEQAEAATPSYRTGGSF